MPLKDPEARRAYMAKYRQEHLKDLKVKARAYQQNPERRAKMIAYQADYYAKGPKRMMSIVCAARTRAAKKGLVFDEKILEKFVSSPPTHCKCCGNELDYSTRHGRGGQDAAPSLDRFDNTIGYTLENTVALCLRCNMVKGDATLGEVLTVIDYIRRKQATI